MEQNDTAPGQLSTVLITPSDLLQGDGSLNPPYEAPKDHYWAYDKSKDEWKLIEAWHPCTQKYDSVDESIQGYPATESSSRVTESYPDNNPKTAFGVKKIPLDLVPPSVEHALAEAFSLGAKKYGPYNWREKRVSSSVYYAAALRHARAWWDGEDIDPESGFSHLSHILACIGILVDARSVGNLNDNRPPKGAAAKLQQEWTTKHG